jgi:hypothetical protein
MKSSACLALIVTLRHPSSKEVEMPGGNGRPQRGMNRKNHHDSFGQSGQQRSGSQPTRQPKYTPPRKSGPSIGEILFGKTQKKGKKR